MHMALERQQTPYLPTNQSLNQLELIEYSAAYHIEKYKKLQNKCDFKNHYNDLQSENNLTNPKLCKSNAKTTL